MAQIDHKHPTMTLYVARDSLITHWICLVLQEKIIEPNIVFIDPKKRPAEFDRINPKGVLPLLVDQEGLILYTPTIIVEYLEERFPHPPLLPIYPIMRAKCRQVIQQVEQGWYGLLKQLENNPNAAEPSKVLKQGFVNFSPIFDFKPYFLSDEVTLVDYCIAPLLWRLKQLNIDLVSEVPAAQNYQERLFELDAFKAVVKKLALKAEKSE